MNAARVATLAVGSTLAALAIAAAAIGTTAGAGVPSYADMAVEIPANATSIEIDAGYAEVQVVGGRQASDQPSAQYWGDGTAALGALPVPVVTMQGTKAVVTIEHESQSLRWGYSPGTLTVTLGGTRLDALAVTNRNGWGISISDVDAATIVLNGNANVDYEDAGLFPDTIDFIGYGQATLEVPPGSLWDIALPTWFEAAQQQQCDGVDADPDYCTETGGGPGVFIASNPSATHRADFTHLSDNSFIRVSDAGS